MVECGNALKQGLLQFHAGIALCTDYLWFNETRFDLELSLTSIFFRGFLTLEKFERGFLTLEKFERGFLTLEKFDLEKFDLEKFELEKFDLEKFHLDQFELGKISTWIFQLGFFHLDLFGREKI